MNDFMAIGMQRALAGLERKNILDQDLPLERWWGRATAEEPGDAYRLLVDACRLAVEETYTVDGDAVGIYAEKAGGSFGRPGESRRFFSDFSKAAYFGGLMPDWWRVGPNSNVDVDGLHAVARDPSGYFFIGHAQEVFDVRRRWGYQTTKVLRTLAHVVHEAMYDTSSGMRIRSFPHKQQATRKCQGCGANKKRLAFTEKRWEGDKERICNECVGSDVTCRLATSLVCQGPIRWDDKTGKRVTAEGYSTTHIIDHLLKMAGGAAKLKSVFYLFFGCINMKSSPFPLPEAELHRNQKRLKAHSDDGSTMAQYLLGKIMRDRDSVVLGKAGSRINTTIKLWTKSAMAGNAYAMGGLALLHRDAGEQATANHWGERALTATAIPEAAYNIAVALGGVGDNHDLPIDYARAAMLYSHAIDIDLGKNAFDFEELSSVFTGEELTMGFVDAVLKFGPNGDDQQGYQDLAKNNLDAIETYMANPQKAKKPDEGGKYCQKSKAAPLYSCIDPETLASSAICAISADDASYLCSTCLRRPAVGEKKLLKCSKCDGKALYCNPLCQRGHWPDHKSFCAKA